MKEINEKLEWFKNGIKHKIHSSRFVERYNDLQKRIKSRCLRNGQHELIKLGQTSATSQCPSCLKHVPEGLNMCQCGVWFRPNQNQMDRIRTAFGALKTPYYRASAIISRGKKSGHNPWQQDHQKAMDATRGVLKRGRYTSVVDRWQNDQVDRASHSGNESSCGGQIKLTQPPSSKAVTSCWHHWSHHCYWSRLCGEC